MRQLNPFLAATVLTMSALLCMGSSFATVAIEEDDSDNTPAYKPQRIIIIKGDQELAPEAKPVRTASAFLNFAPAYADPRATQFRDLGELIGRYNKALDSVQVSQMSQAINDSCNSYGVNPKLLASLIAVESSFRPDAISRTGAIGLGQLKPDTAKWLGVNDPFDPVQNLGGVARYLRYLLDRYNGNTTMALAAYYQGQGTIDKRGVDNDAQYYVSKVAKVLNRFN